MTTVSHTECPYGICNGSGHYLVTENGYDFGRKCKCYDEQIQAKKLEFARIPEEFKDLSIRDFDTQKYSTQEAKVLAESAKKISQSYVLKFDSMQSMGRGLYLYSKTPGSGKTRLAVSIGNALIKHKKQTVRFVTTVDLLGKIRDTWNSKAEQSEDILVQEFANASVLILDDIGVEGNKDWINNIFYRIINSRLTGGKVTIITSNIPMLKLGFDYRLINRLEEMVMQVNMPEESVRSSKAKNKNDIMLKELLG